jgi:hypothetical protein
VSYLQLNARIADVSMGHMAQNSLYIGAVRSGFITPEQRRTRLPRFSQRYAEYGPSLAGTGQLNAKAPPWNSAENIQMDGSREMGAASMR